MIDDELNDDEIIIVNRRMIDRTYTVSSNDRLNEFENWLFSGAINPVAVQDTLNRFYEQMPF